MKLDKPLVSAFIGALSTLSNEIFTRILVACGIGKYSVYQLTSLIVTLNRPDLIIGIIISMAIGGCIALILYSKLKNLVGCDYIIIKSLGIGLLSWIVLEAIYTWLIEGPRLIPLRPVSDYYIEMYGSLVFGFTLGLLFKMFLFKQSTE